MASIKTSTIIIHIFGWLFFLSLPLMFIIAQPNSKHSVIDIVANTYYAVCFVLFATIFYVHTYYVFPKLFLTKNYWFYLLTILAFFVCIIYLKPFDRLISTSHQPFNFPINNNIKFDEFKPPPPPPNFKPNTEPRFTQSARVDIISILFYLLMLGLGIAIAISKQWREAVEKAAKAEADKANAELSFLKAQINPHFLFNTLNNIYSLAVTNDDNTANSIMKLSNIMRYITDDAIENFVSLQNEIDCITDYIDLQRLRLGSKVHLEYEVKGDADNKIIAPLILITFIENVFKYGISNNEHAIISIKIVAEESTIGFYCSNKIFSQHNQLERTGIGIANTQKRLAHLYPNKHLLNIKNENGIFTVQLTLLQ